MLCALAVFCLTLTGKAGCTDQLVPKMSESFVL